MKTANCKSCPALCCKYVALQIDTPENKQDWDNLFWYLHHENIKIYLDHEDDWMIEFSTPCKNLLAHNQCEIYEHRPKVCRNHTTSECEHHGKKSPYKKLFENAQELKIYLEKENISYQFKHLQK